jgi:hypothetical protein
MPRRSGTREYTERANRQDAGDALRGDIVRGLVEIITNADDAYVRSDRDGPITVTVEHLSDAEEFTARVRVADSATGLTADEMEAKLTKAGSRSSDFEQGQSVRGLHGRGFGDVAVFGSVELESIKDGDWAKITLNGLEWLLDDEMTDSDEEIRNRLGLGEVESGATVTINVRGPGRVPSNVFNRLCHVAELRQIITERTVTFAETGTRIEPRRPLYYESPTCDEVVRKEVGVLGYPEASAELVVYEMEEPQEGRVTPESHHGLLICGGRAVYENTLFELDRMVGSGYLRGHLRCPYIDDLIRTFDDRQERDEDPTEENPIRLVSRSRDGLHDEHPFVKRLKAVFSAELLPLIQELAKRHSGNKNPSDSMQQRLDNTARQFAREIADDLADLDEDVPGGDGPDEAPLKIIPSRVVMQPEERKTLTIHIRPGLIGEDWAGELTASSDAKAIVSCDSSHPDTPEPHPDDPELLVSRIRVTSGTSDGNAVVRVTAGTKEDTCTVTVDRESPPPPPPPEGLEFSHSHYNLRPGRRRSVEIWAPLDLVIGAGTEVQVKIDGDPTIQLLAETCELHLDSARGWYSGRVQLIGDVVGVSAELTAVIGEHQAQSHLEVLDPTDPHGLDFQIRWEDNTHSPYRASLEQGPSGLVLTIYGRHPAIYPLLGSYDEDRKRFENEKTPEVSLVLAEIMATEITHHLLEREFARPGERFDASRYPPRYRSRIGKYLDIAQKYLTAAD